MDKLTLEKIVEAAQVGADGNPVEGEARKSAILEMFADADRDTVDALLNEAIDKYKDLRSIENPTDDDILGLEVLVDVMESTGQKREEFAAADAAREAKLAELSERGSRIAETTEPAGEAKETTDPAKATDTGDPAVTTDAPKDAAKDEDPDKGGDPKGAEAEQQTAELVTAAGVKRSAKFSVGDVPKRKQDAPIIPAETTTTDRPPVQMLAASGVRGFEHGQELPDVQTLAAAAVSRIQHLPVKGIMGQAKADIASLRIQYPDELRADPRSNDDTLLIASAVDESRLEGGSITAAGGWCAPSETLYDIPGSLTDSTAGMLDLPEVQMRRGGLRFRRQVDFGQIYSGGMAARVMTETMAESADPADYTKDFYRVDCPDEFDEVRADAVYTGATAGIMQNHAYPEEVEAQISELIAAHAHKVNAITIARAENYLKALNTVDLSTTFGPSSVGAQLNGIGWVITNERYRYRAGDSLRMNVVLPEWDKETLKADYALRTGIENALDVTDEMVDNWFARRNCKLQWVYDWQDALIGDPNAAGGAVAPGTGVGQTATPTAYPTKVRALVYPDGTLVRGRGDLINLEAIYDSRLLETNDFLRLFMEEWLAVAHRAYRGSVVTLPVAVNGATGAARNLDGNGKIQVA
ncbi:major capsid hexamer protein [Gordonia phage Verity]|uniref:Major capsid hexamer protein n=2 Tax=Zitchvirus TaxID=2948963 RepID=A0A514DIS9_9CAUD|nr:major head protein [Gordonia phage Zipp]YP_010002859.1 major head protein [Gordonia phage Verity]QPO16864.1 major capsid hexamer protein [Gordonia phage Delrey21]QXN74147.1 major capsid hexamer protein [Gordonia phage DoctorFroggo]QDH93175.1 major capsid hexamer protein [Gordonia phage Zipp]QDH93507.1 major capsid hexamer protein [Gordonia phage Verity]